MRTYDLSKFYGSKKVVDGVTLNIPDGSLTAFIGPNGAGKSTILNMLARLLDRESGDIIFYDKDVSKWDTKDLAKKLSILKQSNSTNLKITVRDLVSFGRFPHSKGVLKEVDEKKIDEAIEYMDLSKIEDKYLDELSGGQRQRAYIGMILAQDTPFILLDEPLNNIDIKHSYEMMNIFKRICRELKKTIVIVIHDINFTSAYADYIFAFKDGKLIKGGKNEEVIREDILEKIYDLPVKVQNVNGKNVCVYY